MAVVPPDDEPEDWEPEWLPGFEPVGCEPEGALLVAAGCIAWTAVCVFALFCLWIVLAVARWAVS